MKLETTNVAATSSCPPESLPALPPIDIQPSEAKVPRINFAFWNIGKLPEKKIIETLCLENQVDVLLTAEDTGNEASAAVSKPPLNYIEQFTPTKRGLKVYGKTAISLSPVLDDAYLSAKSLAHPSLGKLLLILVHFPSKTHMTEEDQASFLTEQVRIIRGLEERSDTDKTVIVGDFNVNPHEKGMLNATALNAIPCRRIVQQESRDIKGRTYSFFYNPMWQFYVNSDGTGGGTFYHSPSSYQSIYWHILDQVIVRPSLADHIRNVKVISTIARTDLLRNNRPHPADHLPIFFTL